jgi:hypothetical protein
MDQLHRSEAKLLSTPGGALYVPAQGGGRLDNPDLYSVLYLSNSVDGATAEALSRFPEWKPAILEGSPALPGSSRAIARYCPNNENASCDLDDPARLSAACAESTQAITALENPIEELFVNICIFLLY